MKQGRTAVIAGATGATGRELLKLLAADDAFDSVHVLTRRLVDGVWPEKVTQHVGSDIVALEQDVRPDAVFCCLGTTIKKAGSRDNFLAVDLELVLSLGRWAKQHGAPAFHVISSTGVRDNGGNFYLKTKARMEKGLTELGFGQLVIYRPSLLTGGERPEFRAGEQFGEPVMQMLGALPFGWSRRIRPVHVKTLARAMLTRSLEPGGEWIQVVESEAIQVQGSLV